METNLTISLHVAGITSLRPVSRYRQASPKATLLSELSWRLPCRHKKMLDLHISFTSSGGDELLRAHYASNFSATAWGEVEFLWQVGLVWHFSQRFVGCCVYHTGGDPSFKRRQLLQPTQQKWLENSFWSRCRDLDVQWNNKGGKRNLPVAKREQPVD